MKKSIKISVKDVMLSLILLGIFFIPFNSYKGLSFLGEFSKDSCTIFFFVAFLILMIKSVISGKVEIPLKNPLFQIFILFNLWIIISLLINSIEISSYYFKQTSGFSRAIRQYFALLLSGIFFLFTYYNAFKNINHRELFLKIRKAIFYSFIVVSVYAAIETLILKFNVLELVPFLELFNYFPFTDVYIDFRNFRISSVTFEPPALATYLFTVAGWMFSYILTQKGLKKFIPTILTLGFALISGSRAALFIIFVQFFIFLLLLANKRYSKVFMQISKYILIVLTVVLVLKGRTISNYIYDKTTSFEMEDDVHAVSNKSRFGIQYTNFLVFLKKPIFGAGFGQQTFVAKDLYPEWATKDNWEFRLKYLNEEEKAFPPGYNIYIRILAETGIIGLLIFALFLVSILFSLYKILKLKNDLFLISAVILVNMSGLALNWLKMDTFRVFGFWINFALLLVISKDVIKFRINEEN